MNDASRGGAAAGGARLLPAVHQRGSLAVPPVCCCANQHLRPRHLLLQCLLMWGDGIIVVAFRGTASMANVLADIKASAGCCGAGAACMRLRLMPVAGHVNCEALPPCTANQRSRSIALSPLRRARFLPLGGVNLRMHLLQVWRAVHPPQRGSYLLGSCPMVHQVSIIIPGIGAACCRWLLLLLQRCTGRAAASCGPGRHLQILHKHTLPARLLVLGVAGIPTSIHRGGAPRAAAAAAAGHHHPRGQQQGGEGCQGGRRREGMADTLYRTQPGR